MLRKSKILSLLLCLCLLFEQTGFAQVAGTLDISGHIAAFRNSFTQDKFRPLHLRSLGYDNAQNNFRLLLDKGDLKNPKKPDLEVTTKALLNYFFVGVTLPNDTFWVNLRPDSENNIIDPDLATTDVGKILLEADLQLKKDTAKFTSPETLEGKEYWEKLYQKAGELLGYESITIPTLTRPWIVPGEIIIRETKDNAYIYKATLKVMLEQDYLKDSTTYNFDDPRLKTLNEYSSQLIRDLIIPKLTKEINTSQRYAPLRQVYYSLILAQWFKSRFYGKGGLYPWLIDRRGLQGLTSKISWSKTTYFKAYQKSFKNGEYNIQQPVYTPYGQTIRSYFSGGFVGNVLIPKTPTPGIASERIEGHTKVTTISGDAEHNPLPRTDTIVGALVIGGNTIDPSETKVTITEESPSPSGLPAGGLQAGASSVSPTTTNTEETQVTAKQASSPNLGAQVSDVKHLDRLLRLLNVLRRSENVPEVPENASDRDVMEFCIKYLDAKGLITTTTDEDGNVIIAINNNALNHPDETVRRFVAAIQKWVINPEGGVKAVNFQGKDGVWMIVGFESELQNKDALEHEQKEVKYRKQGLRWIEAHNRTVRETGKGELIDLDKARQYNAGKSDEIGAAGRLWGLLFKNSKEKTSFSTESTLNESNAIPLDVYIPYRKLFRASGTVDQDIAKMLDDPQRMRSTVETTFGSLESARLKDLITRQAAVEQSILELVSNASDSTTGRSAPIGRFGMGALQMLAFVIDDDNLALNEGAHIVVETATRSGTGRQLTFFKGNDGRIYFTAPQQIEKKKQGTSVRIKFPQGIPDQVKSLIQEHLRNRLRLFTKMRILMNDELLNPLDGFYYLNGGSVGYESEKAKINVSLTDSEIAVEDFGSGMSDEVLLNKYLIPRLGENEAEPELSLEEINEQVHLFYKPPVASQEILKSRIVFQVSGVTIQETDVGGFDLPPELIIQLPSSTMLTISRDGIEIDETTHLAIKALAKKIIGHSAISEHQVALINGLMQAVRFLDERNGRVDVYRSLVDTAKEVLIPYLMQEGRLMLPNKPEYHELEFPEGSLFIDEELIYKITPELIPGAKRLTAFEPGAFRKAFIVPFKEGAKRAYLPLGPYLLINQRIYEKYKTMPFLLNLRLNFFVGYGRKQPDKGRILSPRQFEGRKDLQAGLLFGKYPVLQDIVNSEQAQWLSGYVTKHPEDGERVQRLLDNLEVFMKGIPDSLRSQIAWGDILPFSSAKATALKRILNTSMEFISPNAEFLIAHGNYFLNREHPERIQRYFTNLLLPDGVRQYVDHPVFHHMLSQVNNKALNYLDEEILNTVAEIFEGANLEGYEDAFSGINKGLPFVSDDGVKRLILRWLRIYRNDPQAALSFMNKMGRHYRREAPPESEQFSSVHKLFATDKIPDTFTQSFSSVGWEWGGGYFTTGLKRADGRSVVVVLTATAPAVRFFAFDNRTGQTEPIGAYDTDTSYVPNSIAWTGAVDGDGRQIFLTTDRYHTSVFAFDIETGEKEKFFVFEHEDHNNLDVSSMAPVKWREPGKFYYLLRTGYKVHMVSLDIEKREIEVLDSIKRQDRVVGTEEDGVGEDGNPVFFFNTDYEYGAYSFDVLSRKFKMIHEYDKHRDIGRVEVYPLTAKPELYLSADRDDHVAIFERNPKKNELRPLKTSTLQLRRNDGSGFWKIDGLQDAEGNQVMVCPNDHDGITLFSVNTKRPNINVLKSTPKLSISPRWWRSFEYKKDTNQLVLVAGEGIYYFDLRGAVDIKAVPQVPATPPIQNGEPASEESWTALEIRSAFAALDSRDDLSGLPSLVRGITRFLKDENVDFVSEESPQQRDKTWKVANALPTGITVAWMNYIFDRYSQKIKANPRLTFDEFLDMIQRSQTANISDYVDIIRSAIQGQDKTRRAWVRELIQNARDAMRREREEKRLKKDEGLIEIRNFISQGDWVFSIRDTAGMNLWHLLRYYFPLDQTSKDHLKDTGNLGQGNYTLFADFDRVFIRTSTGDGLVHEIVIKNSDDRGPVIDQWDVMKGDYKGTEIRRIKEVRHSDPQLESLFIQEAMENFAGAIQSPESRESLGQELLLRDFEVTYNGQPFSEEIEMTFSSDLGDSFGSVGVGRGKDVNHRRVMQDELFIKTPDADELRFVPQRILQVFERFGGLHISIGKEILLNIPRTGYAQKHKFLNQLRVAVLYNVMRTVLKDYMDRNSFIYGMPPDYFSNEIVVDNPEAQKIAELMYSGQYNQITETMLMSFIQDSIRFFELLSHVPFTSNNHNGEINLHRLRELRLEENKIRRAREERARWASMSGSWNSELLKTVFEGKKIGDEFSFDFGGRDAIEGKAGSKTCEGCGRGQSDSHRGLTPEQEQYFLALNHRVLRPIVGSDMPQIGFFSDDSSVRARAGVRWGKPVLEWNLGHMGTDIQALFKMAQDPSKLKQSLEWETEGGLLWEFLETEVHESQHLPKFEQAGDHTHHSDETIDRGFAQRMGKAFDVLLYDVNDFVALFTQADSDDIPSGTTNRKDNIPLSHSPENSLKGIIESNNKVDSNSPNREASSSAIYTDSKSRGLQDKSENTELGGIDFRALPIVNQRINMGILKLSVADLSRLNNINLDSEWIEIQNMVNAGIIPSNERIKEYVLASCLSQNLDNQMNKVLGCIADIMRMEEDRVTDADVELKGMLVLIEAGKPETELQCGLSQIKISPQEPQLITP